MAELKEECDKGWFEDFDESKIIEIIGANTTNQNQLVAQLYEKEHGVSLAHDLKDKCGPRLFYALNALLLTKQDFLAMRLHDAMRGWGANKDLLTRLLGGLDGEKMMGVAAAFEKKYDQPLWSALKAEINGDFLKVRRSSPCPPAGNCPGGPCRNLLNASRISCLPCLSCTRGPW